MASVVGPFARAFLQEPLLLFHELLDLVSDLRIVHGTWTLHRNRAFLTPTFDGQAPGA